MGCTRSRVGSRRRGWLLPVACGITCLVTLACAWFLQPASDDAPVAFIGYDAEADRLREFQRVRRLADTGGLEAAAHVRQHLEKVRRRCGAVHAEVAEAAMLLADLCRDQDRVTEARQGYAEVLAVRTQLSGPSHWQARQAQACLEDLDRAAGQNAAERENLGAARDQYRRALRLYQQGKYLEALPPCEEALRRFREGRGETHADVADALHHLGLLYAQHGDHYLGAEALLRQALELYARSRGEDHPAYAICLRTLATLADDRGEFEKAEELYERALDILRSAQGERTAEYARTLNKLGQMLEVWWQQPAEATLLRSQQIREQILDKDDPDYAESVANLGMFFVDRNRFEEAERVLRQALAIRERALGPGHPDVADNLSRLAVALNGQGDYAQSAALHRAALDLTRQSRGSRHPLYARYLLRYAELCNWVCDWEQCELACRQALAIRDRLPGDRHPDRAVCYTRHAGILHQTILDSAQAERLYEQAAAFLEQTRGERFPPFVQLLASQVDLYY